MIKRLDHIGIAVQDLAEAGQPLEALGLAVTRVLDVPRRPLRVAFLPVGDCALELLQPTQDGSDIAQFIQQHGEGLHHVCFEVDDIAAALEAARAAGLQPVDAAPRQGASGLIAFLQPEGLHGLRVELVQKVHEPQELAR